MSIETTFSYGAAGSPTTVVLDFPNKAAIDLATRTFLDLIRMLLGSAVLSTDAGAQPIMISAVTVVDGAEASNISATLFSASPVDGECKKALTPHLKYKK